MSWMQKLCETYDNCYGKKDAQEGDVPLLPIAHTTFIANIDVYLDEKGNFLRAVPISDRREARTVVPCTEESGSRTSGAAALPLCDYTKYVASDLQAHTAKDVGSHFDLYRKQLKQWCDSEFGNDRLRAVLAYVDKGTVVSDLIREHVLIADDDGMLETEFKEIKKPDLYKNFSGFSPDKAFLRWHVEVPGRPGSALCGDREIQESWSKYYVAEMAKDKSRPAQLDMVSGQMAVPATTHLAKLRSDGDSAKLISSNDTTGYTYRGRFQTAAEACTVGYVSSQKAHIALRWLISRQGLRVGDWCFVCWSTHGNEVLDVADSLESGLFGGVISGKEKERAVTDEELAELLNKRLTGSNSVPVNTRDIVMLSMNSASKGRLSILFYRELTAAEYAERVGEWYRTCSWPCRITVWANDGTKDHTAVRGTFPPSFGRIIQNAYGKNADDAVKQNAYARLTQCVADGAALPADIVQNVIRRAGRPESFDSDGEWQDCLTTACALYRKVKIKEAYKMVLDRERKTRSYLYGRLLAVADVTEYSAMAREEKRQTNAKRLMTKFSERPYSTWKIIDESLAPYWARLGGRGLRFEKEIQAIMDIFTPEDFTNNHPLEGEYLLAYYTENADLWKAKENEKNELEGE